MSETTHGFLILRHKKFEQNLLMTLQTVRATRISGPITSERTFWQTVFMLHILYFRTELLFIFFCSQIVTCHVVNISVGST